MGDLPNCKLFVGPVVCVSNGTPRNSSASYLAPSPAAKPSFTPRAAARVSPYFKKREVPIVTTAPPSGFKCDGISPVPASPVQVAEAEVVAEPDTLPWQQPPYHPCKSGSLPEAVVAVVAAAVAAEPRGCPSSNGRQD